jgi:hypothetical protein
LRSKLRHEKDLWHGRGRRHAVSYRGGQSQRNPFCEETIVTATIEAPADKVWYLAAGEKTVGPMTAARVRERIAAGKIPAKTRVRREGEEDDVLLAESPEFADAFRGARKGSTAIIRVPQPPPPPPPQDEADEDPSAEPAEAAPARPPARPVVAKRPGVPAARAVRAGSVRAADAVPAGPARGPLGRLAETFFPQDLPTRFEQPHRIERTDLWHAFGMGFDRTRVSIVLITLLLTSVASVIPFLPIVVTLLGMGALSYHTRRRLEGESATAGEAWAFARRHLGPLVLAPLSTSLAVAAPVLALAALGLSFNIPYAGPIGNGLLFGVHIVLGLATLFLMVAGTLAWSFGPTIVAFEETTTLGTIQVLFDFVRRSTFRTVVWSIKPSLAYLGFALGLLVVAALCVAIPAAIFAGTAGLKAWTGELEGLGGALVLGGIWIGILLMVVSAILSSVQNGLIAYLYLGGRRGNDDLVSRDMYLARRAEQQQQQK